MLLLLHLFNKEPNLNVFLQYFKTYDQDDHYKAIRDTLLLFSTYNLLQYKELQFIGYALHIYFVFCSSKLYKFIYQ